MIRYLILLVLILTGCPRGRDASELRATNAVYAAQQAQSELIERKAHLELEKLCCKHCIKNPKLRITLKKVHITAIHIDAKNFDWVIIK